jgi:hypothetical protein
MRRSIEILCPGSRSRRRRRRRGMEGMISSWFAGFILSNKNTQNRSRTLPRENGRECCIISSEIKVKHYVLENSVFSCSFTSRAGLSCYECYVGYAIQVDMRVFLFLEARRERRGHGSPAPGGSERAREPVRRVFYSLTRASVININKLRLIAEAEIVQVARRSTTGVGANSWATTTHAPAADMRISHAFISPLYLHG